MRFFLLIALIAILCVSITVSQSTTSPCNVVCASTEVCADGKCVTACRSNDNCSSTEYCKFTAAGCDGPGRCVAIPTACDAVAVIPPLCGCDGKTYNNLCYLASARTNPRPCPSSGTPPPAETPPTNTPLVCSNCPSSTLAACPLGQKCCSACGIRGFCGAVCPAVACFADTCKTCDTVTKEKCVATQASNDTKCIWCPSTASSIEGCMSPSFATNGQCSTTVLPPPSCSPACSSAQTCVAGKCVGIPVPCACKDGSACSSTGTCVNTCEGQCKIEDRPTKCPVDDQTFLGTRCLASAQFSSTDSKLTTSVVCVWSPVCSVPPVTTPPCVVTGCHECVDASALSTEVAAAFSAAPLQTTLAACVKANVSTAVKTCIPIRIKSCQRDSTGKCGFTSEDDYNKCLVGVPPTPPPVVICKGIGDPCGCSYSQGCVYFTASSTDGSNVAVCTTNDDAAEQAAKFQSGSNDTTADSNGVVTTKATSLDSSSAAAASAAEVNAPRLSTITVAPPVCLQNANLKADAVANVAASSPEAAAIVEKGFNSGVATSTLSQKLAKLSASDELAAFVIVIVAFPNPVADSNGVKLSSFVDCLGNGQLSTNALTTLCGIVKSALAASCGADESKLIGCDYKVVSSSATAKRFALATNATDSTRYSFSTTLPASTTSPTSSGTSGVSAVTVSVVALLVSALLCLLM